MHFEERGLLEAIIEEPGDDALRLIYADWVQDHGNALDAEFIRAQIRLSQATVAAWHPGDSSRDHWEYDRGRTFRFESIPRELLVGDHVFFTKDHPRAILGITHFPIVETVHVYCHDITEPHPVYQSLADRATVWAYREQIQALGPWVFRPYFSECDSRLNERAAILRRGLIDRIRCKMDTWMDHGHTMALNPLTFVEIVDKKPLSLVRGNGEEFDGVWGCVGPLPSSNERTIPSGVFDLLDKMEFHSPRQINLRSNGVEVWRKGYKTKQQAIDALSAACILWARNERKRREESS